MRNLGPGVTAGRYDIPSFNALAPRGTSIFALQKERESAAHHFEVLEQKFE